MKRSLSIIAGLFALLAVSCTQEKLETPAATGEEVTVSFTAALPDVIATKAYSDGLSATKLTYAIYSNGEVNEDGTKTVLISGTETFIAKQASFTVNLATGKTYDILFWAESENFTAEVPNPYAVDLSNQTMTVDYKKMVSNNEDNDAFYAFEKGIQVTGALTKEVTLYRPFAQINLGTNDFADAKRANLTVGKTTMTAVEIPNVLDFADGSVSGDDKIEITKGAVPHDYTKEEQAETFPIDGYEYLCMNYVLVGKDSKTTDLTFYVEDAVTSNNMNPAIVVSNVPVQRNYRTNIYGSLLTDPANVKVVIDSEFKTPAHEVPADVAAIYEAAKNGGEIALESDVVLDKPLVIENDLTINLNGHNLEYKTTSESSADFQLARVYGKKLTIEGTGSMTSCYYTFRVAEGGELNLKGDVNYYGNISVVQVSEGNVNISAGTFDMVPENEYGTRYMLNCVDSYYKEGKAAINVTGGTFVDFNPENNLAEGQNTNFVAEGYEAVLKEGTENTYEVKVKTTGGVQVTVATAAELQAMLTILTGSGTKDNTININANIELAEGENWTPAIIQGYTGAGIITINGNGHYISGLNATFLAGGFAGNAGVVINDLTIKNSRMPQLPKEGTGSGMTASGVFMAAIDAGIHVELNNCKAENCEVISDDYAGLVGYFSAQGDSPDGKAIFKECEVTDCKFTGKSVGGLIGHCMPKEMLVEGCVVNNCEFYNISGRWDKTGYLVSTINGTAHEFKSNSGTGNNAYPNAEGTKGVALDNPIGRFVKGTLTVDGESKDFFNVSDLAFPEI